MKPIVIMGMTMMKPKIQTSIKSKVNYILIGIATVMAMTMEVIVMIILNTITKLCIRSMHTLKMSSKGQEEKSYRKWMRIKRIFG